LKFKISCYRHNSVTCQINITEEIVAMLFRKRCYRGKDILVFSSTDPLRRRITEPQRHMWLLGLMGYMVTKACRCSVLQLYIA